jgi:hypothetical protein
MKPEYRNGNVSASCPDCGGARSTFEFREAAREYGAVVRDGHHQFNGQPFKRILYVLMRCAGCGRGGIAKIHDNGSVIAGTLEEFFPISSNRAKLPPTTPEGVEAEFREAELCAAFGAWRAASALFRSALEKALKANGYTTGLLAAKIDAAAGDGVITESRRKRAHEEVRVLGNDVLHEDWKPGAPEDVAAAHHYAQRILEDLYDDRPSVEALLKAKRRIA